MAIVLIIIGIILGSVLKGQDLIAGAKEKKFKSEVDQLTTSYYTYYDKYSRLPGDDNTANPRWAGSTNGNNNGILDTETAYATGVLDHLRRAGLLTDRAAATNAAFTSTALPGVTMAFGYGTAATWTTATANNLLIITGITAADKLLFDTKYDDGVATTGKIRGIAADLTNGAVAAYTDTNYIAYLLK
jgi:hypothetical protein